VKPQHLAADARARADRAGQVDSIKTVAVQVQASDDKPSSRSGITSRRQRPQAADLFECKSGCHNRRRIHPLNCPEATLRAAAAGHSDTRGGSRRPGGTRHNPLLFALGRRQ